MATITIQELQDIAVQCTSDFFNNNIPLNESLAKEASARELNSDQLKRAVEATNTLTFLKSSGVSTDRTSEFPVADYESIIKIASVPGSILNKEASALSEKISTPVVNSFEVLTKQAEDKLSYSPVTLTEKEKVLYLQKYAQINAKALETAQENLAFTGEKLVKLAKVIKQNPQGLEHLSASSLSDEDFTKIASLIFNACPKRLDFVSGMFKSAQLQEVETFIGLFKEAESLFKEVNYRSEAQKKILNFEKKAFVSNMIGSAAKVLGKTTGTVVRKTGVGTVKTLGKLALKPVSSAGKFMGVKAQNWAAGTSIGKKVGVPTTIVPNTVKRNLAATSIAGGAAIDAAVYSPKVDPAKDASGSVWSALNGRGI